MLRVLLVTVAACAAARIPSTSPALGANRYAGTKPNFLIILTDDHGFGDVGHNNPLVKETVAIDALAAAGMTFKDMHTFPLCTPSRAQLLTGRVSTRTGVTQNFGTNALYGLPRTEKTIAELLKQASYSTAQLGKWHLGVSVGYHPTFRGFDRSLTVPYSVDMGCMGPDNGPNYNDPQPPPCPTGANRNPNGSEPPALALYNATRDCGGHASCNAQIVQAPLAEVDLDGNYAGYLDAFFSNHSAPGSPPFFAYMAMSHIHVPLFFAARFANTSARNTLFGDTLMEMDDTFARIWASLRAAGLEEDTLVLATSDNGPWEVKCELAGSPGPFVGAYQQQLGGGSALKDTTWEGGQHVFGLAHWPGKIPAGAVSHATVSSLDFLPTILALAGVPLPADRTYDGVDLAPLLFGNATAVRDFLFMPDVIDLAGNVTSVRYRQWKAYSRTSGVPSCTAPAPPPVDHPAYLIFDLDADPGETTPVRPPPDVLDAIWSAHRAFLLDINATFRSTTDYASGPSTVASGPCCNPDNAVCRCHPDSS